MSVITGKNVQVFCDGEEVRPPCPHCRSKNNHELNGGIYACVDCGIRFTSEDVLNSKIKSVVLQSQQDPDSEISETSKAFLVKCRGPWWPSS